MQSHVETGREDVRAVKLRVQFDPAGLRIAHTLIGVTVHLEGCATTGVPGSPALPLRIVRVALPAGMRADEAHIEAATWLPITGDAVPLAPIQPTRAGATSAPPAYRRPHEEKQEGRHRCPRLEDPCGSLAGAFEVPDYVPPDPAAYEAAANQPLAQLLSSEVSGLTPIAIIALRPVRIAQDGRLELAGELAISVQLAPGRDQGEEVPAHIVSRAQALRDIALTKASVVNPRDVIDYKHRFPIELFVKADYLILTDNSRWDAVTLQPAGPAGGDLVASFERLAAWKRQRGLQATVISVADIVGGVWGDFRTGARDLQEVIRNFLKMAYSKWGVAWVLIGGDTGIVPVRYAAGGRLGEVIRQSDDPPPENRAVWSTDHLRVHAANLGEWWSASSENVLVRRADGKVIPYDAMGTSGSTVAGWLFTTDATYSMQSAVPTDFIRVNGPQTLVDADLQFLYRWNSIPTDLYYSSLVGEAYNLPGRHDWDLLDNEVYGYSTAAASMGGINYWPTLSLGRAPVNTSAEADAFVDKLIAYEKFEAPDGTDLDPHWPARTVIVSENWDSNWGGRDRFYRTGSNPPKPGQYYHEAASDHTIVQLSGVPDWDWSLLSMITEDDVRLLPYRTDAAAAGRGWYFASSATDLSASHVLVSMGPKLVALPMPSRWLAVYGPEIEIAPPKFVFNSTQLDGSLADQEQLREFLSMKTGFGPALRLYEDVQDMSPSQLSAAPLKILSDTSLREALNAGPHIVSLSGHGSNNGCCRLYSWTASALANGFHSFIGYGDSCLTSQLDSAAMGEALLTNPKGGAVAYIGNSRFSWVGVGDDFQRAFFDQWAALGKDAHLGLLADTRGTLVSSYGVNSRWAVLALNLLGCPEMPLWWRRPGLLRLPPFEVNERIRFELEHPDPPDPPFDEHNPYAEDWDVTRVHVRQGERQLAVALRGASVDIPMAGFGAGPATLSVSRPGCRPAVKDIRIGGSSSRGRMAFFAVIGLLVAILVIALLLG